MGLLHEKMLQDLRLKGFAWNTQRMYLSCARQFAAYHHRSPAEMGEDEIRHYLLHLVEKKEVSPATHFMHVAALKFLYRTTLGRPEEVERVPWPKVPRKLPDILSGEEVERLLQAVRSVKYRAILSTAYGAGLRISEVCPLQITDIDSKRMLIHVRFGKGKKHRYVALGRRLLSELRHYWKCVRPPGPYLFPGGKPGRPIEPRSVRRAVSKAVAACGFRKRVSPHSLRHGYATHLLQLGIDIRIVQSLLGHAWLGTTNRYTHLTARHVGRLPSPLDLLGTKQGRQLG
jgi:site-specific recombinase XerD